MGILSGSLPPRIHGSVVTWASVNRQLLIESWNKYQTRNKPEKFPYYGADLSWIIEDAGWYEDYKVKVWFRDDSIKIVNLEETIFSSESSLFKPLRDKDSFMELRYDSSLETVVWPNGADIAPEYLYENGELAPAIEEEFKARKIS
ncbi:MAG: DUF2442 domain-containing protein [Leptolyngbya sp. SIO3F4]|nr:DUF2442 domain-containing protein [Leptolyngbya sp. SIO3F4]